MKILMVSDSPTTPSGFGRHAKLLIEELSRWFEMHCFGIQHFKDQTVELEDRKYVIKGHRFPMNKDYFGELTIPQLLKEEKYDIIFTIIDTHMVEFISHLKFPQFFRIPTVENGRTVSLERAKELIEQAYRKMSEHRFKWVALIPVDGEPIPPFWKPILEKADQVVAMSEYGAKLLSEELGYDVPYIYHPVSQNFYPEEIPEEIKVQIIGNVNRNQHRKQIPRFLEACIPALEKYDDTRIYLHCNWNDEMGWDIGYLVDVLGIKDKVIPPLQDPLTKPLTEDQLRRLYNTFTVFASATAGEGFGLTTAEAMACGLAPIITDYTTSRELIGENERRGWLVPPITYYWDLPDRAAVKRALVDINAMSMFILEALDFPEKRKRKGKAARWFAQSILNPLRIARQWKDLQDNGKMCLRR